MSAHTLAELGDREAPLREAVVRGVLDEQPTAALAELLLLLVNDAGLFVAAHPRLRNVRVETSAALARRVEGLRSRP